MWVVAFAVGATAAAQASAATLAVTKPCYVSANAGSGAPIVIVGSGFTPGDTIEIEGTDVFASGTASPAGQIMIATGGPILSTPRPGVQSFRLTAKDAAGVLATTTVTMANFSVDTTPSVAKPTSKVTWHFSGFTPGKTVWVHYVRKAPIAEMSFGRAKAPCGTLTAKRTFYPGGHPQFSKYTVVFDQVKRYTKRARPRIVTTLSFF